MHPLVLHVDIDAFFASVEQIRNPRLANQPVAVGSGVIASCSYEARQQGLRAGMPLGKALRRCPALIIVRGHEAVYRSYAMRLFEICQRWSPLVEEHLDEAYCDLSGTERLYPQPIRAVTRLREEVKKSTGLTVTAGLGRNRMFARLIGKFHKPDGIGSIAPEQEEQLLQKLSVAELPGVGPRTEQILVRLGIETVEQLRQLTRPALRGLLGRNGEILYQRCRGEDHRCIGKTEIPRTIHRGTSFDEDVSCPRVLQSMLEYLCERATRNLRQRGLEACGVTVRVVHNDHLRDRRRIALQQPTSLDPPILRAALSLLKSMQQRRTALRFVGVVLDRIRSLPSAQQGTLFESESHGTEHLDSLIERQQQQRLFDQVDRIRTRHGHGALLRGSTLALLKEKREGDTKLHRDRHGLILRSSCLTR